jgi:integrase
MLPKCFPAIPEERRVIQMKFTKQSIAALTMPEGKTEHFEWDGDLPGFGVRLRKAGSKTSKTWCVQYRFAGGQKRPSLKDTRKVELDDARKIARQMFAKLALGIDPAAERAQAVQSQALTLKAVASRYLEFKRHQLRPSSLAQIERYLNRDYKPLHDCPMDAIKRADIAALLQDLSRTNGRRSAGNARAVLQALFAWAAREGLCESNPAANTNDPAQGIAARARTLDDREIKAVWDACQDDEFGRIVRLLLLTGCRRLEIGELRWSEIDLATGLLTIPGARTKNHHALTLPLPAPALDLLRAQPRRHEIFVFPGTRGETVIATWARNLDRLNAKIAKAEGKELPHWTLHDLRRTMRTNLGKLNVAPHVAERALNHIRGSSVEAIYDKHRYEGEIGQALALWAEHLMAIVEGRDAKVVPLSILRA